MPMSKAFEDRLHPDLRKIADHFGTPFHIYDEAGIKGTGKRLKQAFANLPSGFGEFFAVKALPNPRILQIMYEMGFGFDCSSIPELVLAREAGAMPGQIMFTSNNTSQEEFDAAMADGGCRLNLDDISFISKVPEPFPRGICFRYNPGEKRTGNAIIGNPVEAKYGVSDVQIVDAYGQAILRGAECFGLHTMLCSNERNYTYMVETIKMLLELVERISLAHKIKFDYINFGGGLGIPYRPEDNPLDLESLGNEAFGLLEAFKQKHGYAPELCMESGRFMTGPHGVLVAEAINRKSTYREYVGVDACQTALMRPALYDAYHHITVLNGDGRPTEVVDIVGAICENCDKFAKQRELPVISEGDLLMIHDTGAHGLAMGFNYNGRLRPKELLLRSDGTVELIRRAETIDDLFATLTFEPESLAL
ncbi:MAG: diaminopimelate decarboxylase [Candidatus Vogelbacteria bacterium]|nr:diaminopimelate decarboxylase [Candidatus Vogelbacteria bacterium]